MTGDDTAAAAIMVKGQDVRVGDDLWSLGKPHRVTPIEPYTHPVVTRDEEWRIAYSNGPEDTGKPWGRTLRLEHGYAASYEVAYVPGDDRKDVRPPADDYLSPFHGEGGALYERYMAEGAPGPWRRWLAAQALDQVRLEQAPNSEPVKTADRYVIARVNKTYATFGGHPGPQHVGKTFVPYDDRHLSKEAAEESASVSNDRYRPNFHGKTFIAVRAEPIPGTNKFRNLDHPSLAGNAKVSAGTTKPRRPAARRNTGSAVTPARRAQPGGPR